MNLKSNSKYFDVFIWYLPFCMMLKWIAMYRSFRNGVIVAFAITGIVCIYLISVKLEVYIKDKISKYVLLYALYNTLMLGVSLSRGYPFSMLLSEYANCIIPIAIFFISRNLTKEQSGNFEIISLITIGIVFIVGLYYNIRLDDPYYIKFLEEANPNFSLYGFTVFPRLNAMFGSVICGSLGCIGTCFSYNLLERNKKCLFWIFLIVSILLSFFSLQRSAMISVTIITIILMIYAVKKKYLSIIGPVVMGAVVCVSIIIIQIKYPSMWHALFLRTNGFGSAISERSASWNNAMANGVISTIFGYGLGTGGQRAIGISQNTVNDGNYYKIIYDCGLVGFILFATLVSSSLKNYKRSFIYSVGIFSCLLQMIGSNILTFQLTASLFWYIMGQISNCNQTIEDNTKI